MKITRESTGEQTALVKIEIAPEDYAASVEKQIMDYKRKANLPGFRPGHIPTGLVRKMYGKAIMADEINKLISENLMNYIRDEKLDILGNPLPNTEKTSEIDFEAQGSYEFYFDLGIAPEFTIPVEKEMQIDDYQITVDDEMLNKYIEDTRKRYGKPVPEGPADENATGENKEEAGKNEPVVEPAGMNPEFYNMVYPGLGLETEEDFREQVRKDASAGFSAETDKLLFNNIIDALVKNTEMRLPDEFLKRWLAQNNEGKYPPGEIEKNYPSFAESMKWQLIENKLIRDNGIEVKDADIRNYIGTYMLRQINMKEVDPEMQKRYDSVIDTLMQNKEQVQRINDQLYNQKLMEYFKASIQVNRKEVTYEEYIKLASAMHPHDHEHHEHDHEHEHEHEHEHDHEHEHEHENKD
jgi:trigger factor